MTGRILVVEDEMYMAMVLKDLLSSAGYCVFTAPSVSVALGVVENEPLDGAILDINLGGETVYAVAAALRSRDVPFAFASAYDKRDITHVFGDCRVLSKPYTCEDVLALLDELIARAD